MKTDMKKTKIVCTIGPKTESKEMLGKMLDAGMKRDGSGKWTLPDGTLFSVPMMSMNETNPTMNRCASMVVECPTANSVT
mgnify:CR=1 FL=1